MTADVTHLLSLVVWAPLVGAIAVAAWPASLDRLVRPFAAVWATAVFGASLLLARGASVGGLHFVEDHAWVPALGARYLLGVDAVTAFLAIVSALAVAAALAGATREPVRDPRSYFALLLALETTLLGGLVSLDLLLALAFWSAALVPAYLLVAGWGGERATSAANALLAWGAAGCAATLVAVALAHARTVDPVTIASLPAVEAVSARLAGPDEAAAAAVSASLDSVRTGAGTLDVTALRAIATSRSERGAPLVPLVTQTAIFWLLALGAAARGAVFPLHGWLRETVETAPPAAAAIVAGPLASVGALGLFRLAIPLAPDVARDGRVSGAIAAVAAIGVVWSALVALASPDDPRRVTGAWSVACASLAVFSFASLDPNGFSGGVVALACRSIVVAALVVVGAPRGRLAVAAAFVAIAAAGLPPFGGFVASALALSGARAEATWRLVAGAVAVGALASAMAWIALERSARSREESSDGPGRPERSVLAALVGASITIGVAPAALLKTLARPAYALAHDVWHVEGQPDRYAATPEDQERLVRERAEPPPAELPTPMPAAPEPAEPGAVAP